MRLGAPVDKIDTPENWIAELQKQGYRAAYYPLKPDVDSETHRAYVAAAAQADIVIAEVGAWSNPISSDDTIRNAAIQKCQEHLALADEVGARCCVNIAGSRGDKWDGPHKDNQTHDTFDLIVETTRQIIDAVKPKRTYYTLEAMPWVFPESPESYLELIKAIDREQCAAHLDPVNMINSPYRYFTNTQFLNICFSMLRPYIKSIHAKDTLISDELTVHIDEVRPGLGTLDYKTFIREANKLDDVPFMLEHLPMEEYPLAAKYVRNVAASLDITL